MLEGSSGLEIGSTLFAEEHNLSEKSVRRLCGKSQIHDSSWGLGIHECL